MSPLISQEYFAEQALGSERSTPSVPEAESEPSAPQLMTSKPSVTILRMAPQSAGPLAELVEVAGACPAHASAAAEPDLEAENRGPRRPLRAGIHPEARSCAMRRAASDG